MTDLTIRFLGTGDPFGTGGRFQSCVLLEARGTGRVLRVLLDCGATTPLALARAGIDPATVDGIIVSHWHGDHFGGVPFLVLDELIGTRHGATRAARSRPLWIAGPAGTEARLHEALAVFRYAPAAPPGDDRPALPVEPVVLEPGSRVEIGPLALTGLAVVHTPEALGLRLEIAGRAIGYSGDTAWTEALPTLADGADLFICQTYTFEIEWPSMLSYRQLARERGRLGCRRLILTHIGAEMQRRLGEVSEEVAEDGLTVEL